MSNSKREYHKASVRDKHSCILCNNKYIHRHHVIYRSHFGADIEQNIVCLCVRCHQLAHHDQNKYQAIFLEYLQGYYGLLEISDLKKESKYKGFKYE